MCRNLSHSGIHFETDRPLDRGASLDVTIDTKSEKFEPMHVRVEILRVEPSENNLYFVAARIVEYK